jgi:hypothetical protein
MRNARILLSFLIGAAVLPGCTKKKAVVSETPAEVTVKYSGVVTLKGAPDCPVLVMPDPGSGETPLLPIGLDKQYLQEGLRLKFTYRPSRASSGSCIKGSPAILEDITVIGGAPAK